MDCAVTHSTISADDLRVVLATDCGSTTTKALLFEKKDDGWHVTFRGEAPTTVEKPLADVTIGAINAFRELEELSGRKILVETIDGAKAPFLPRNGNDGIDLYISTSSAGGGLQMVVLGVIATMTAASAERAALGGGAIVMDTVALDDGREAHEQVEKIRHLRPDIVLLAGGTDGGTKELPIELAELLLQAEPRPRFGDTLRLPVIYAGNRDAAADVQTMLEKRFEVCVVANLRPTLEKEVLEGARDAIHELFLNHVMSHAPGYRKLLGWSPVPILPTPAAFGEMVLSAAKRMNASILAVDIGGATTDVFSALHVKDQDVVFHRTVSANLGMSYSVANVLDEAGEERISRWLPFQLAHGELQNRLWNKMIRPTTIPQTLDDLIIEQAVCREALRLSLEHHKRLAVGLKGMRSKKTIGDFFRQSRDEESLLNMRYLDLIIGSGGVLSHAPDRRQTALMLIDAYEPLGVTRLAVDSIFMMPHLGVLSTIHSEGATEIFERDCLINLGTVIAPIVSFEQSRSGKPILEFELQGKRHTLNSGELKLLPFEATERVSLRPTRSDIDVGAGAGEEFETTIVGGVVGIILDGRGRPLRVPNDHVEVRSWYQALGIGL